jgi:hypothetical protein
MHEEFVCEERYVEVWLTYRKNKSFDNLFKVSYRVHVKGHANTASKLQIMGYNQICLAATKLKSYWLCQK